MDIETETDIERLRQVAKLQDQQLRRAAGEVERLAAEIAKLKGTPVSQELRLAVAQMNGETPKPHIPKDKRKAKRRRSKAGPTPQPQLPKSQQLFELDEADKTCPSCGGELRPMEGQTEDSELIDVIEVQYTLTEVKRQKYSCRCGCMETAEGPARTQPGGRYSLDFGVKVATDKYGHHLPLERQVRVMKAAGLNVTSQTLWKQVEAIARWAKPTWRALKEQALRQGIIGLDQTGWPRLDDKSKKKWQMWCITTPKIVYHTIRDDKSAATFLDLVGDYDGYIVCDDLGTHLAGARGSPGVELVGCWAHIYRKFEEASADFPQAEVAMRLIHDLYEIDRLSAPEELAATRDLWSRMILDELYQWMTTVPVLTTTKLGKAIKHTLKLKERLWRLVDDPNVWLDNNPTERSIRGPVVGRRNHFGSKSKRGTEAASVLYSLVETAKLNKLDPKKYIHAVVEAAQRNSGVVTMPWDLASA